MDNNNYYQQPAQPVQPVQPEVYQQPVQYPAPYYDGSEQEMKERTKKANLLCLISIALRVIPYILTTVTGLFGRVLETTDLSHLSSSVTSVISLATSGASIASWVLVIIARAKYRESKFAKILLIVYICELVVGVIAAIALIIWCAYACHGIPG